MARPPKPPTDLLYVRALKAIDETRKLKLRCARVKADCVRLRYLRGLRA